MRTTLTILAATGLALAGCPAGTGSTGGNSTGATAAGGASSTGGGNGAGTGGTSTGGAAGSGAASTSGTAGSSGSSGGTAAADGGFRFPASAIFYQDVAQAQLDPQSAAIIGHLADGGGWGTPSTHAFQIDFSLAVLTADATVEPRPFTEAAGYYTPDCDDTTVPVPPGGNIEGQPDYACDPSQNDCHLLVYQGSRLYELYNAAIAGGQWNGSPFTSVCEVVWDLTHDYWQSGVTPYSRGDQCTSADAAGMPIAPLLVTGAELQAGVVSHAMRFTLPNAEIRKGVYVHPGTHAGGPTGDSLMPPYAARFRLRGDYGVSALPSAGAQAIARALQAYGMFLDDGGNIPLTLDQSAAPFVGSHDLAALAVTDFEVVAPPDPPVTLTYDCTRTPITQ
ncbi:MAG: hypothetical protein ACYDCL_04385 [Myxococcales bacterium]